MDGSIELKSKAGVGTTVIVKIPFKIGTQDKNSNLSDKLVSLDDYSVEGMRALVVEDNVLNMEISRCILEDSGMEVTCAADGQEAVEIFEKSAPDYFGVIYMDIMMSKMNGRRWYSRLLLAAGKKTIPAAVSCSFLAWVRSFLPFPLVWRYRR